MAAARVVHVACSEYPGMANTLRKQLLGSAELNALVTVKSVDPNDCREELQKAEVVFADPGILKAHVASVSHARWIHSTAAGVNNLVAEIQESTLTPSFLLTRSGGVFGQVMAEYVLGQIIANERMFYAMHDSQRSAQWTKHCFAEFCRPLSNLTIGILGVGDIGRKIAAVSKQLGMQTWGLVRALPPRAPACPHIDEYRALPDLEDLLCSCDYICNVLPSTSETQGLLSGSVLESCKAKQAVFINIGRGDITDEDTIVRAIQGKWISKAILDVFPVEPLPRSSPLWSMSEVVITPHVSGSGLEHQVCRSFIDNLRLYLAGRPLQYLVDWTREY